VEVGWALWIARALGAPIASTTVPAGDVAFIFVAGPRDRIVEIGLR
jgi:hypothetical protein